MPIPSPVCGVSLERRGPPSVAARWPYTANVGCGRMLSQSPPVTVHFQLLAFATPPFTHGEPSTWSRLFGSGNGVVTMGSVGQRTSTRQLQSWDLLLRSRPSQSKSPRAQTSSANGGWAPRHSPSHTGRITSLPIPTHLTVPTAFTAHQPTGCLVVGSICVDDTSEHTLVVPTGCAASQVHPSSTKPSQSSSNPLPLTPFGSIGFTSVRPSHSLSVGAAHLRMYGPGTRLPPSGVHVVPTSGRASLTMPEPSTNCVLASTRPASAGMIPIPGPIVPDPKFPPAPVPVPAPVARSLSASGEQAASAAVASAHAREVSPYRSRMSTVT